MNDLHTNVNEENTLYIDYDDFLNTYIAREQQYYLETKQYFKMSLIVVTVLHYFVVTMASSFSL